MCTSATSKLNKFNLLPDPWNQLPPWGLRSGIRCAPPPENVTREAAPKASNQNAARHSPCSTVRVTCTGGDVRSPASDRRGPRARPHRIRDVSRMKLNRAIHIESRLKGFECQGRIESIQLKLVSALLPPDSTNTGYVSC